MGMLTCRWRQLCVSKQSDNWATVLRQGSLGRPLDRQILFAGRIYQVLASGLALDIFYLQTKFGDSRIEIENGSLWLWPRPFWGWFVIRRLGFDTVYMQNLTTLPSAVPEISLVFTKFKWFAWPGHASFRDSLPSMGWHLLWSAYLPNLRSLPTPTTKIWRAIQNIENGMVWGS